MRTLYQARQDCLLEALQRRLGGFLDLAEADAGMHLIGWLPAELDDQAVAQGLVRHRIHTYALGDYCLQRYLRPGLLIGFSATPEAQAAEKVAALAQALQQLGLPV
ncbi:hypothetical protein D3C85_1403750 [compost metagenome]